MIRNYVSVKFVKAEPCKAWKKYGEHDVGADGYKIYYQNKDKYVSWCPKEEFEKQYLQLEEDNKITQKDVDMEIGKQCCMEHIKDKIWGYLGFLLQSARKGFNDK